MNTHICIHDWEYEYSRIQAVNMNKSMVIFSPEKVNVLVFLPGDMNTPVAVFLPGGMNTSVAMPLKSIDSQLRVSIEYMHIILGLNTHIYSPKMKVFKNLNKNKNT